MVQFPPDMHPYITVTSIKDYVLNAARRPMVGYSEKGEVLCVLCTDLPTLANGRAKLEQRLARWLLMAHDRMTTDAVPLTHEFLAVMLGVRRAGVTVAIHGFERRGLVTTRRGQLTIVNRAGIEQIAGSFYGTPESELKRLLGELVPK